MSATATLTTDLKRVVLALEDDLRQRVADLAETDTAWRAEHHAAVERGRTASAWSAWRDDRITQVAVSWVLTTVFVRFCEDNALLGPVWISGPGDRHQEALEARDDYFRTNPEHTDREWIEQAVDHLKKVKATAALVDSHAPLHLVSPSGDAATKLLEFWWRRDEDGRPVHDLRDPEEGRLDTRFLGDLYQDLSEHAKSTYALLQTPVFVEEFILDRTLEPALADRPLQGFRMIDPTCGSGHFLLGAFARLLDRWNREAPAMETRERVQKALDAVNGVDINPFAVAIARFRLTVEALQACGETSLERAPGFTLHLATGDSLLHGHGQHMLDELTDVSGFAYEYEDLPGLQEILEAGRYDVVVGNPPYITVKDKVLNQAYRDLYATCKGTYALTVPFMERFFGLAKTGASDQPAGWVGQITSNSFMKREFGSKIIEDYLVRKDLRLVADTSGAYIPGHGTPTVILVGRNQRPVGETVRAVLGVRGEPGRPGVAEKGLVWRSLVEHVDEPGFDGEWVSTVDVQRSTLSSHPWNLSGGDAPALSSTLSADRTLLSSILRAIGYTGQTNSDDAFIGFKSAMRRVGLPSDTHRAFLTGTEVRDFNVDPQHVCVFPYDAKGKLKSAEKIEPTLRYLWPLRTSLSARVTFSGATYAEDGRPWWQWHQVAKSKLSGHVITWPLVQTHNHFVFLKESLIHNRHAPIVQISLGASEDDHLELLGVLNSSTACFWLKQNSHNKGNGGIGGGIGDEAWEPRYEFTGTTLQDYPLPSVLPLNRGRRLDALAQQVAAATPSAVAMAEVPSADALHSAHERYGADRAQMIAVQEELDWEVYRSYGLIDEDLTYPGAELPALSLGERAFEIVLARKLADGKDSSAWFTRHGSTPITSLPTHWPADYRALVQRRIDLIESDPSIRLLEKPENKRRWASEPWEKQQTAALRSWLLDRLESRSYWFDRQGRPAPLSVAQLADRVERDPDFVSVLALWQGTQGVPVVQSLVSLLADEAVPYLAAWRYKDSGLRKRADWESTWALQRREDAGEPVGVIPVPPKYANIDFRKVSYWQARGKLDVPKERFVLYPSAGRSTDPTPLLGWAGWDHAQQALALLTILGERESEGFDDTALVPLVAGLAELQPWVEQWHSEVDPDMGVSLAGFCATQLSERMTQVGATYESLLAWRPPAATRGRARKVSS